MQHGMLSARRRPRRSQPKGFTLVELMITVSIIAILVGAAIGGIYNYRSERVGLEAARQIAERLRGLHRMAIASNRAVVLRINEGAAGALSDNGARGRIEVLISSDNTCANVGAVDNNATMDLQFNAANPTAFSQRFRVENVQIVTVSPHTTGDFDLVLCIKPDGRVVDLGSLQPLSPDANSTGICGDDAFVSSGDATQDIAVAATNWEAQCDRPGVMCMRIANINDACPAACNDTTADCRPHYGVDNIIVMNYTGQTRLVR